MDFAAISARKSSEEVGGIRFGLWGLALARIKTPQAEARATKPI
jgi:hypothetical protein